MSISKSLDVMLDEKWSISPLRRIAQQSGDASLGLFVLAAEVLKRVEWSGSIPWGDSGEPRHVCPVCEQVPSEHSLECQLAGVLFAAKTIQEKLQNMSEVTL